MNLGINGLGRIGKLSLWHHVSRKHFNEIVINIGREVGQNLDDLAAAVERDSTYGRLATYLHGHRSERVIEELDDDKGTMRINGVPVKILRETRNPAEIAWRANNVQLVVDTTGVFKDPTADADSSKGSIRGHLHAGAEKVMLSAPFKIQAKGLDMPEDAITTVMGINDEDYIASKTFGDFSGILHHDMPLLHDQTTDGVDWRQQFSQRLHGDGSCSHGQPAGSRPTAKDRSLGSTQESFHPQQHHPDNYRCGQSPVPGHSGDEKHWLHCRICAGAYLNRFADRPGPQPPG